MIPWAGIAPTYRQKPRHEMEPSLIFLHMSAIFEDGGRAWALRLGELCGRVRFAPAWSSGTDWWRTLKDFDLWFVWSGRGTMELGAETIPLSAGTCVWMRPGRRYVSTHDPAHPLGVNFFHFDLLDEQGRPAVHGLIPPVERMRGRHVTFTDDTMQRILALRDEPDGRASAERLFAALLAELVREALKQPRLPTGVRPEHAERINEIMTAMRTTPAKFGSVAALAKQHGFSVSHFSRVFEAVAGVRPQPFLIAARIDHARDLLALTPESVGSIAHTAGFSDIYYFSRLFKRRVGVSPSVFRINLLRS
jgi:AraC-like DNA-binding protein